MLLTRQKWEISLIGAVCLLTVFFMRWSKKLKLYLLDVLNRTKPYSVFNQFLEL